MTWAKRLCEGLVMATVVALPLCLGGAPWWSLWVLVAASWLFGTAWVVSRQGRRRRKHGPPHVSQETEKASAGTPSALPLLLGAAGVCLATALLQLIPLPDGLLAALSPRAAELKAFALEPLGLLGHRPITLDGPSTWRAVARVIALTLLFFVSSQLSSEPKVRRRLVTVLAAVATVVAFIGLAHSVAQVDTLFGLYQFVASPRVVTPFGNINHLAACLALGSTLALGLAASAQSRDAAVGWAMSAVLTAVVTLLTVSRSGIGGLLAGWFLVAAIALIDRTSSVRRAVPWLALGGVVLLAIGLAAEPLIERWGTINSVDRLMATKIELWPSFFSSAQAHRWVGMGLGAFELGYSRDQVAQLDVTFTHPENVVLQWLAEAGFLISLVLGALVVWAWVRAWRRWRGQWLERVVLVALLALVAHDLFDFALEFNALAAAAALAAGVVSHRRVEASRGVAAVMAGALVLATVASTKGLPTHVQAERELVAVAEGWWPAAQAAIDRHPADWVLYAEAAQRTAASNPRDALAWANRVLFLRPNDGAVHASAARALAVLGQPTQALLEARLAFERGDGSALALAVNIAEQNAAWGSVLSDTPGTVTGVCRYASVRLGVQSGRACVASAIEQFGATTTHDEAHLLALEWALGRGDAELAQQHAQALSAAARSSVEARRMHAQAKWLAGDVDGARTVLKSLLVLAPGDFAAARALSALEAKAGRIDDALDVLGRLRPFITDASQRLQLLEEESALHASRGQLRRAADTLEQALRLAPRRFDLHYQVAVLSERQGALARALAHLKQGQALDSPQGAESQVAWRQRLEQALSGNAGE